MKRFRTVGILVAFLVLVIAPIVIWLGYSDMGYFNSWRLHKCGYYYDEYHYSNGVLCEPKSLIDTFIAYYSYLISL